MDEKKGYSSNVYRSLKDAYGDQFTLGEDEFAQKIELDADYQKEVHGILKAEYGDGFTLSSDDFSNRFKKKEDTGSEEDSGRFTKAWNGFKNFFSADEDKEVKDNLEILGELKKREDNPFSQEEIRKVEYDIKKGITDNNDGVPFGVEIRKGTDDLAKARLMYESWEDDPKKTEKQNIDEFHREFLEYTGRGNNVAAAESEDEYRRTSTSTKDALRTMAGQDDNEVERIDSKETSDSKEKQKRKTGTERMSLGANRLQKELLGHEIKEALDDPETNEIAKSFNETKNEIEQLSEELNTLNKELEKEPDAEDPQAIDAYNVKVGQFNEMYKSYTSLQEFGIELSQNPKLLRLAKLDEKSNRVQKATTQMFMEHPEMFAEFREREEKQKVIDDLYKKGGAVEYAHRAVVNQAGRALTNMVGGIMNIPTYFDADDKYTGIDAWRDFTFKAVDYVDELSFAIPTEFSAPLSEVIDGKRVYNTELLIPKAVRTISDMFTLMYGASKFATPFRAMKVSKNISQGIGLFTSSYLTTHNNYYKEAVAGGLSPSQASKFATTSAMVTSALEMINPQRYLLGGGSVKDTARNYVKALGKGLAPKVAIKKVLKDIGTEVGMEELQEFSQLVGDRVTQYAANKALGGQHFKPSEKFMDEAIETFVLTAIATPFAAAKGAKGIANEYYYNAIKAASENPDLLKKLGTMLKENKVDSEAVKRITRDIQDMQTYKGTLTYNAIVKGIQERMKLAAQANGEEVVEGDSHGDTIADHIGERVAYGEIIGTLTVEEDGTISVVTEKGKYYEVENSSKDLTKDIEDIGLSNTELTRIQLLEHKLKNPKTAAERKNSEAKLEEAYERYEKINGKPAPRGYVSGGQEQTDTKTEEVSDKDGAKDKQLREELEDTVAGIKEGEEQLGGAITEANKRRIAIISEVVNKALAKVAPNTTTEIVESWDAFAKRYKEYSGKDIKPEDKDAAGFYDEKSNSIVIDASRADKNVTFHEFAHPIAKAVRATNPEAYQKMVDLMEKETFTIDGEEVTYMEFAKNEYEGEALTAEEAVVEFLADMASEKWDKIQDQNVVQKLVSMAKKLLEYLGISNSVVTLDLDNVNTPQELRKQLEKITDAMVEGKPLELSKEQSQGKDLQKSEQSQGKAEQKNPNLSKTKFFPIPEGDSKKILDKRNRRWGGLDKLDAKAFKGKDGKDYILVREPNTGDIKINAYHAHQPIDVGVARFYEEDNHLMGYSENNSVEVTPPMRRNGIASAMYDFAEAITGKPVRQSPVLSEEADGFWANRNNEAEVNLSKTPAFKKWFGKSKVVNEDGSPKVMYHGTRGDVDAFQGRFVGAAIMFTPDSHVANDYAKFAQGEFDDASDFEFDGDEGKGSFGTGILPYSAKQAGQNVMPIYLKMENPIDLRELGRYSSFKEFTDFVNSKILGRDISGEVQEQSDARKDYYAAREIENKYLEGLYVPTPAQKIKGEKLIAETKRLKEKIVDYPLDYFTSPAYEDGRREITYSHVDGMGSGFKNLLYDGGFDGLILNDTSGASEHDSWAVYEPSQIKSATGNSGEFDIKNDNIAFSKPKFKKWFGESKVVNEDGSPKVVYHGTGEVFTAFREELANYAGYYFAEERQLAQDYADYNSSPNTGYPLMKMDGKTPVVLDTYLSIENPAYYDAEGKLWTEIGDEMGAVVEEAMFGDEHDGVIITNLLDPPNLTSSSVPPSTVYIAKNPNQIKSVDNNGEFSSETDNIYLSKNKAKEERTLDIINTDLRHGLYEPTHIPLQGGNIAAEDLPTEPSGRVPDLSKPKRKNMIDMPVVSHLDIMKDKFSVTMSDHTLVGDVHNQRTGAKAAGIMGGVGFSYIKGNVENEIVWAGVTIKAARLLVRDSKGMPATLVFRMARESGSMGNFTYLTQAIEELKAPIKNGKITEKEFLERLNEKLATVVAGQSYQKKFGDVKSLNEFSENLAGASFGYRGNLWKTILKNDNVAHSKGNPWYTFLNDLEVATIAEINDVIAESVTDQAIDGDIVAAIEVYDPEMVEVPVGKKGKTKLVEKIYTTDKSLVNEANGIFFTDAPHHNSYPYVVKGKPIGIMDSFLPITEYYPNMKRWLTHDKNGRTKAQYDKLPAEEKNLKQYNPKNAAKMTEEEYNALPIEQRVRAFEKRLKSPYKAVETMVAKLNDTHKGAVKNPKVTEREPVFSKPKKLSRTAVKIANSKRESLKPLRDDIKANPDRYSHEQQNLEEVGEMLSTASAAKIETLFAHHIKLASRGSDTNVSTMAAIEKLNRININLQNAIDTKEAKAEEELREQYTDTLEVIVQAGTSIGQLLRQYGELTKGTSIGLVRMVRGMLEKKGFHLDAQQEEKVTELAREYLASDKLRTAKLNELVKIGAYDLLDEYEALNKETLKKYQDLANFMMRVVPKGKAETLGLILQGNLLTPLSIATNIIANTVYSPFNGFQQLMADLVAGNKVKNVYGYHNVGNFLTGWKMAAKGSVSPNMEIQDMAKFDLKYDLRAFSTFSDIFLNPEARKDWAKKNGKTPASVWTEKILTGTAGLNADMMFRALYFGDKPFRNASELAETWRIVNEKGAVIKNKKDFRIFELQLNEAEKERIKEAGNIATFSDKRALSSIADKTVRGINALLEEMISPNNPDQAGLIMAKVFFKAMIPYVRVPANLLQDTAEFAMAPFTLMYAINQHAKGNKRLAGRYYGKAITGATLYLLGELLWSMGAIVGDDREDDEALRSLEYEGGKRAGINMSAVYRLMGGSVSENKVGDLWIDYKKLGQIGMFMSYYANSRDIINENGTQDILSNMMVHLSKITGATLEASFMTSLSGMLDAMSGDNGNFAGQVASTASTIIIPNNYTSMFVRPKRNYILSAKDRGFLEKIGTKLKLRVIAEPEGAEPVISFSGQLIDQTAHEGYNKNFLLRMLYQNVNLFKPERVDSKVAIELIKLGRRTKDSSMVINRISDRVKLPEVKLGLSGEMEDQTVKVHPSDLTDLKIYIGRYAYARLTELIEDSAWDTMTDSERVEEVKAIYQESNGEIRGAFQDRLEEMLLNGEIEFDEVNNTYNYTNERKKFDNPV